MSLRRSEIKNQRKIHEIMLGSSSGARASYSMVSETDGIVGPHAHFSTRCRSNGDRITHRNTPSQEYPIAHNLCVIMTVNNYVFFVFNNSRE